MATHPGSVDARLRQVQVAVLAKAPIAGLAKTRLIPALGPRGAARVQRALTASALRTAMAAQLGAVTLWCAPDASHRYFRALRKTLGIRCLVQPNGDLGRRMHAAFRLHCMDGPLILTGTDCPALTPGHLHDAAQALCDGQDAVFYPAEDGGYVLVGLRSPIAALFDRIAWSTSSVMSQTRARAMTSGLKVSELETLWDVDVPEDLPRLRALAQNRSGKGLNAACTAPSDPRSRTG